MGQWHSTPDPGPVPSERSPGAPPPLLVVFDIDETLVHTTGSSLLPSSFYELRRGLDGTHGTEERAEFRFVVRGDGPAPPADPLHVHCRPGLPHLLATLGRTGIPVAVWSMGTAEYVDFVVDGVIRPLLGRDPVAVLNRRDCTESHDLFGRAKDLRLLELRSRVPLGAMVLVEDQPSNAPQWQQQQVVQVPPFRIQSDGARPPLQDSVLPQLAKAFLSSLRSHHDATGGSPTSSSATRAVALHAQQRPGPYARPVGVMGTRVLRQHN